MNEIKHKIKHNQKILIILIIFLIFVTLLSLIFIIVKNNKGSDNDKGSVSPSKDSNDWLDEHNSRRKKFGYPEVEWSDILANQSLEYAKKLSSSGKFEHGDYDNPICFNGQCGQNLEKGPGSNARVSVTNWYNECKDYKKQDFSHETGHFTQVVWKDTKKIGCGTFDDVSVCLYDVGNVMGQFTENTPKPGNC